MSANPKPRYRWRPMQRTQTFKPIPEELVAVTMQRLNLSREEALAYLKKDQEETEVWVNDLYQVQVRDHGDGAVHLNIRRRDGAPILRDWRHFQAIKNEILGPECEAVELYPAESRLVDTSNKYHLWGTRDPKYRFPFGFDDRLVDYEGSDTTPGLRQRPL